MLKIVLPGLAMIAVTYAMARLNFGLFLPDIANDLQISESEGGLIGSLGYVAYTFALFFSALLMNKVGSKGVNVIAGTTAVIGLVAIATAHSFLHVSFGVFIAGLGSGFASPALSQQAKLLLPKKQVDQGNTWINSGTSFGLMATAPVVLLFTEQWRLSFWLFACIGMAVLIWNVLSFPTTDLDKIAKPPHRKRKPFHTINQAKYLLIASYVIGMTSSVYWTFGRSFLTVEYGATATESILFWLVIGVAGIVGGLAGGLIQRIGLSWSYRLILIVLLSSMMLLNLSHSLVVFSSAALFGGAYIFLTGLFIVWATRMDDMMPSTGVSLSFLALGIGQSLGSFVAGKLIESLSYSLTFTLFSLAGLIGLIIPIAKRSKEHIN
ncbi:MULTISPECIES: MFS transporter [Shouchella]|uniref:Major facilitator superfamily domain-containing protein n=3 Tax=Bacillaceae TaxID=186817 RepID=A0A060LX09_9BACI|nr:MULTISPECIES: MFS transporter [Bacillaceae]AIC94310.1 Major facilitator superfamily domain-containing protein [Shouchella lehensis G1]KQL58270.1 permease [Alkalicoccobacillus plakortidis]MBG9785912.1 permease [Shouchella lehensis]TES48387.1 MFS transporter [Shouchella lehensis]